MGDNQKLKHLFDQYKHNENQYKKDKEHSSYLKIVFPTTVGHFISFSLMFFLIYLFDSVYPFTSKIGINYSEFVFVTLGILGGFSIFIHFFVSLAYGKWKYALFPFISMVYNKNYSKYGLNYLKNLEVEYLDNRLRILNQVDNMGLKSLDYRNENQELKDFVCQRLEYLKKEEMSKLLKKEIKDINTLINAK